jgi:hypothetical protein
MICSGSDALMTWCPTKSADVNFCSVSIASSVVGILSIAKSRIPLISWFRMAGQPSTRDTVGRRRRQEAWALAVENRPGRCRRRSSESGEELGYWRRPAAGEGLLSKRLRGRHGRAEYYQSAAERSSRNPSTRGAGGKTALVRGAILLSAFRQVNAGQGQLVPLLSVSGLSPECAGPGASGRAFRAEACLICGSRWDSGS